MHHRLLNMNRVLKEIAKAYLPLPIQDRLRRYVQWRREPARPIDLSYLRFIRNAKREELADARWLEAMLPRLGLNAEWLHQFPSFLYPHTGKGLRHWQYPNQFSRYLAHMAQYNIETYLEIGVRHGGTFVITVEYLNKFHPVKKAVGVDIRPCPGLLDYRKTHPNVRFEVLNSQTADFQRLLEAEGPFDLALIDGDHSEAGCRKDFETVRNHAKIIVLHDIVSAPVPGVGKVWEEVKVQYKDNFDFFEYINQYDEVVNRRSETLLGIGVAIRKNSSGLQLRSAVGNEVATGL